MRRLAVFGFVLLAATNCSPSLEGASQPLAQEQVAAGLGLGVASARRTALDFVNAYAHATEDDGARLSALVVGPKLTAWVHWMTVQNQQFDGTISGTADVRSVAFVDSFLVENAIGGRVNLGASVTLTYDPAAGETFDRTRIMDGPVILLRTGTAEWRVVDATRDGQSMDDGIQLFKDLSMASQGVTVTLHSLFMFTPAWQFNVGVVNRTGGLIRFEPERLALLVRRPGPPQRTRGVYTQALVELPNGFHSEGLVSFPQQAEAKGRTLSLAYRLAGGRHVTFAFPLGDVVTQVAPTSSGPSPAPTS
ncbi:MAG TPA: hypothetical protein VGR33_02975 [Actinomycetota bacterium]|jgi:hypothetical protein|nr:hypothetical protein [Actinomycetota bacterium]